MNNTILWLDTETTGVDYHKNGLIQISAIAEREGKILGRYNEYIRPFAGVLVSRDALAKNKIDIDELRTNPKYVPYSQAHENFTNFLGQYVDKYDKSQKYIIAGKKVDFDIQFMRQLFDKCDDQYYGSWFIYPSIDIESIIAEMVLFDGLILKDYKLETICKSFNIEIKECHNSIDDIEATRKLFWKLKGVNDVE